MGYSKDGRIFYRDSSEITDKERKLGQTLIRCEDVVDGDSAHKKISADVKMTFLCTEGKEVEIFVDHEEYVKLLVDDLQRVTFLNAINASIKTIDKIENKNKNHTTMLSMLEDMKNGEIKRLNGQRSLS